MAITGYRSVVAPGIGESRQGCLTYVRADLEYESFLDNKTINRTGIIVDVEGQKLYVMNIYNPPLAADVPRFRRDLIEIASIIDQLESSGRPYIITGDFNVRGYSSAITRGLKTHQYGNIDHIISNVPHKRFISTSVSDHLCTLAEFEL